VTAGADPTYAVGSELPQTGTNAADGAGDLFVAEADESDGAFLVYQPQIAVVTNVEADHLDHFGTEAAYRQAFVDFVDRITPGGFLVSCADDPGAVEIAQVAGKHEVEVWQAGFAAGADVHGAQPRVEGTMSTCVVWRHGVELGELRLQVPGHHYLQDALLALAVGLKLGYPFEILSRGLAGYVGSRRRMEFKGTVGDVRVYDSYAHHPTEIAGDLAAARAVAGNGRLVVCFQPHLVSRTRAFGQQMGQALGAADEVVVLDVYAAREAPDPRVTGALVAEAVPLPPGSVEYVDDFIAAPVELVRRVRPGDLVLTLGAGSVTEIAPAVMALLAAADV
jgi:UDP-N-acetylmuramate--alanine ligase